MSHAEFEYIHPRKGDELLAAIGKTVTRAALRVLPWSARGYHIGTLTITPATARDHTTSHHVRYVPGYGVYCPTLGPSDGSIWGLVGTVLNDSSWEEVQIIVEP